MPFREKAVPVAKNVGLMYETLRDMVESGEEWMEHWLSWKFQTR